MAALVALTIGGAILVLIPMGLAWAGRKWGENEPHIRAPRQLFTGHDEELEQQSRQRREKAEALKREGRRVETQDDKPRSLRKWGNGWPG